jgi:hypothetical protein
LRFREYGSGGLLSYRVRVKDKDYRQSQRKLILKQKGQNTGFGNFLIFLSVLNPFWAVIIMSKKKKHKHIKEVNPNQWRWDKKKKDKENRAASLELEKKYFYD